MRGKGIQQHKFVKSAMAGGSRNYVSCVAHFAVLVLGMLLELWDADDWWISVVSGIMGQIAQHSPFSYSRPALSLSGGRIACRCCK